MRKFAAKLLILTMLISVMPLTDSTGAFAADNITSSKIILYSGESFTVSVKNQYSVSEDIVVSWSGAEDAEEYELVVFDFDGEEVFEKDVTGSSWNIGKLPNGDYTVTMTPYFDSENGDTVSQNFTVGTGNTSEPGKGDNGGNSGTNDDDDDDVITPPKKSALKIKSISYNEEGYFPNDNLKFSWEVSGETAGNFEVTLKSASGKNINKNTSTKSVNFGKQPIGDYTLTVVPYTSDGTKGTKRTVSFSVYEEDGVGDYDDDGNPTEKKANPLTLRVKSRTYIRNKDLRKSRSFLIGATNGVGNIDYSLSASAQKAKIKVMPNGKVKLPKGCKRGKYIIIVSADGDEKYDPVAKTVKIMVK